MKKKTSKFTLVRKTRKGTLSRAKSNVKLGSYKREVKRRSEALVGNEQVRRAEHFTDSLASGESIAEVSKFAVLKRVPRNPPRSITTAVGIVDLGTWMSELPALIEKLNSAQKQFRFYEVQAPVPAGLVKHGEWYEAGGFVSSQEASEMEPQIFGNDFFRVGEDLRAHFKIDVVAGVTPAYIAVKFDELNWNLFSVSQGKTLLISTCDLREFARKAKKPFEALVGFLLIGQLLASLNHVQYHKEDRGCLFDFNASRVSIVKSVRRPMIEPSCMEKIDPKYRASASAFMEVLGRL